MFHDLVVKAWAVLSSQGETSGRGRSRRTSRRFSPQLGVDALEARLALSTTVLGVPTVPTASSYLSAMSGGTTITVDNGDDPGAPTSSGDPATDPTGGDLAGGETSEGGTTVVESGEPVGDFPSEPSGEMIG